MLYKKLILLVVILLSLLNANAAEYDFNKLSLLLGYPDPTYFGSSEDEIQDLETYTSKEDTFYQEINSYLRFFPAEYEWNGIGPDAAKLMVNNIDHIFARVPALPDDLIVFRGIDLKFRKYLSYSIGDEFIEKAYVSTSTSFSVARYFAVEMNGLPKAGQKRAIFLYYMNKPQVKGILFDQGEDEVILNHGEKIRVMAMRNKNLNYDLYLAQICSKDCAISINSQALEMWNHFKAQ